MDFYGQDYIMTTFNGAWGREFEPTRTPCGPGGVTGGSRTGTSSSKANPFVKISQSIPGGGPYNGKGFP